MRQVAPPLAARRHSTLREGTLLVATFVQHQNPLVRALWAAVAPRHRQVVPALVGRAARSERNGRPR